MKERDISHLVFSVFSYICQTKDAYYVEMHTKLLPTM
jgi:hypothetical protein